MSYIKLFESKKVRSVWDETEFRVELGRFDPIKQCYYTNYGIITTYAIS